MKSIIDAAAENNIDAIIAMDLAAILYAGEAGMTVHISAQIIITNIESVKFYAHFADTVVISRELTLKQVSKICSNIKKQEIKGPEGELIKLECLVDGALCMTVSDKCYLSLHWMNSSANRDACKKIAEENILLQLNKVTASKLITNTL